MPKSVTIYPREVRSAGTLEFAPVPINAYSRSFQDEVGRFACEDLIRLYRDMALIREFETMLNDIKVKGAYHGIEYNHRGPAHLSIGQEASAVGQAFLLDPHDHIFGSHRSHGEIIAKGLSAIHKLEEADLLRIMEEYRQGITLRVVEREDQGPAPADSRALAMDFLLYGALAEIFGREAGFNAGMG
ncbi:MAG TPA: thiamine pyrophosphate-dependent enzyme, partial [Chthonomonadales bacterium]|nr:thiamine pyrophosphate-dependent enzyme [Chthonomonadales bacterium]